MKILLLSTLSLAMIVAVFALGYANPSFADKPGSGICPGGQPHCHGDEPTETETTFEVKVLTDEMINEVPTINPVTTSGACVGTSTPSQHLTVQFFIESLTRFECGRVEIEIPDPDGDGVAAGTIWVYLLQIAVKQTKRGDTVSIFFTEEASIVYSRNEHVWNSDALPVKIAGNSESVLITEINGGKAFHLTKTHQPNKRDVSIGEITVGEIIYTSKTE